MAAEAEITPSNPLAQGADLIDLMHPLGPAQTCAIFAVLGGHPCNEYIEHVLQSPDAKSTESVVPSDYDVRSAAQIAAHDSQQARQDIYDRFYQWSGTQSALMRQVIA